MTAPTPWFVHNSGRYDRTTEAWVAALVRLRERGSIITGTEAAGRGVGEFRTALAGSGWEHAHLPGAGPGDTYAAWDTQVLRLVGEAFPERLTDRTWKRDARHGGGQAAFVHALVLKLREITTERRYWIVVVHMPLDNTDLRAEVWRDCCKGLVDLFARLAERDPDAVPVLVGDWNKNLREPDESAAVARNLSTPLRLSRSWDGRMPDQGTHGRQLIDFALAGRFSDCQLLRDHQDSDHRAFRYRLVA